MRKSVAVVSVKARTGPRKTLIKAANLASSVLRSSANFSNPAVDVFIG